MENFKYIIIMAGTDDFPDRIKRILDKADIFTGKNEFVVVDATKSRIRTVLKWAGLNGK